MNTFGGREAHEKYRQHVINSPDLMNSLKELSGKNLGAFGNRNHGVVLISLFCENFGIQSPEEHSSVEKLLDNNNLSFTLLVDEDSITKATAMALLKGLYDSGKQKGEQTLEQGQEQGDGEKQEQTQGQEKQGQEEITIMLNGQAITKSTAISLLNVVAGNDDNKRRFVPKKNFKKAKN